MAKAAVTRYIYTESNRFVVSAEFRLDPLCLLGARRAGILRAGLQLPLSSEIAGDVPHPDRVVPGLHARGGFAAQRAERDDGAAGDLCRYHFFPDSGELWRGAAYLDGRGVFPLPVDRGAGF